MISAGVGDKALHTLVNARSGYSFTSEIAQLYRERAVQICNPLQVTQRGERRGDEATFSLALPYMKVSGFSFMSISSPSLTLKLEEEE